MLLQLKLNSVTIRTGLKSFYVFFSESCSIPSTCYTLSSVIKTQLSLNITAPGEMQFCLDQGIRGYDLWIP